MKASETIDYRRFVPELWPGENPFSGPHGRIPRELAGRDSQLENLTDTFDGLESGRFARGDTFVGPRGIGKSALLTLATQETKRRGWILVEITPTPIRDFEEICYRAIVRALMEAGRSSLRLRARPHLPHLSYRRHVPVVGGDVEITSNITSKLRPHLDSAMRRLRDVALQQAVPIVIAVDEVDLLTPADGEVIFKSLVEPGAKADAPITLLAGGSTFRGLRGFYGMSTFPTHLTRPHELKFLTNEESLHVLQSTASQADVVWEEESTWSLAVQCLGSPLLIQNAGRELFDVISKGRFEFVDAVVQVESGIRQSLRNQTEGLSHAPKTILNIVRDERWAADGCGWSELQAFCGSEGVSETECSNAIDLVQSLGYVTSDEDGTYRYREGSSGELITGR